MDDLDAALSGVDDDGERNHDDLVPSLVTHDADTTAWTVSLDHKDMDSAINAAAMRSGYDPATDTLTPAFINDIQGITAEYLVADALNATHDGLEYRLFADPSHPDVDIAGVDVNGNIVRLLQVKATSSKWYATGAIMPGIEVITSSDSWTDGLLRYDLSSADLRRMVSDDLHA